MPTLYVMDVPEFAPLVEAGRQANADVRAVGNYIELSSAAPRLVLQRRLAGGLRPAIWFAALTAVFVGAIARFDDEELWLDEEPELISDRA
jgi:hypothetical protein